MEYFSWIWILYLIMTNCVLFILNIFIWFLGLCYLFSWLTELEVDLGRNVAGWRLWGGKSITFSTAGRPTDRQLRLPKSLPHLVKTSSNKARKQLKTKKISQNKTIKEKKKIPLQFWNEQIPKTKYLLAALILEAEMVWRTTRLKFKLPTHMQMVR